MVITYHKSFMLRYFTRTANGLLLIHSSFVCMHMYVCLLIMC